jgi:RNA polymerase sigma-70 factor (ECF subfamily)
MVWYSMNEYKDDFKQLVEQAIAKNENACQKILNLHKGMIFSYVFRMVRNFHDAEEITFDTFIKCFNALHKYDPTKKFTTWLFTIAHNTTIDFLRKSKQEYEYFDERHAIKDDFIKELEQKRKMEKIERALNLLAPIDREIVILFHKEEHSYQEISAIMDLPVTTIKTRLHRARKKLSRLVKELT